jgi:hypothetical protein
MPLVQDKGVVPAIRIKECRAYVGICDSLSSTANFKVELTAAAVKGAVQLVITDVPTGIIRKNNYLLFKDPTTDMVYYPVQVGADYTGGTNLVVAALKEAMPDTVEAMFLSELCYRTEQSNEGQQRSQSFETICHTVAEQIAESPTYNGNFPGGFSYYDSGIKTLEYAALNQKNVLIEKRFPVPSATGWKTGRIERGFGIPSFSGGANNGAEALNFKIDYSSYTVIDSEATA